MISWLRPRAIWRPHIARTFLLAPTRLSTIIIFAIFHLSPWIKTTLTTSGMPTKATTPTASKLDSAQHDHPIDDDGGGNLSERHVKERFKVLSEDKKPLFMELGTEFERRQIGWGAYLGKKLKTPDLATKWMFFRWPKLSNDPDGINSIDFKIFRDYLATTNWKTTNEKYDRVFDLMWNNRSDYPTIFLLKTLNKHFLAVEVNPRCLTPRDPIHDSLEAYDIIDSNLINILGIKYHSDRATKKMIIAPFGRSLYFLRILRTVEWLKYIGQILSCTHPKGSGFPWRVSEYALMLQIREDGVAGDFYFVYNAAEAEDSAVNLKPALCSQGPFTVGKEKQSLGLGLLGGRPCDYLRWLLERPSPWLRSRPPPGSFNPDEDIQLNSLSTSIPEIVMTGIRKSQKGSEIVGFYDKE